MIAHAMNLSTESTFKVQSPVMRYHGGKWLLAPWIISHMPSHRLYLEPFGGAASVLLRKQRAETEIYADIDSAVVNTLIVLRDQPEALVSLLSHTDFGQSALDSSLQRTSCPLQSAARMIVRATMSRASSSPSTSWIPSLRGAGTQKRDMGLEWRRKIKSLVAASIRLQGVAMIAGDAFNLIRAWDSPDTLMYLDPPYLPETRGVGKDYKFELTEYDHARLLVTLRGLKSSIMISGYPNEMYRDLLESCGWKSLKHGAFADTGLPRTEAIWLNPLLQTRLCSSSGQFGRNS